MLLIVMVLLSVFEASVLSFSARLNDELSVSSALKQAVTHRQAT